MNGISSSGLTAGSILSGMTDVRPKTDAGASQAPSVSTEDVLVKSEKEDVAFKRPSFLKTSESKNPFKKMSENEIHGMKVGAGIGAAVGGIAGGITAYNMSWNEIKATNEVNSVTLDWQEPVMRPENLGKIPSNYYSYGYYGFGGSHGMKDVIRDNPVMENGKPVMQGVEKTFSDYGEPVVTWKDNSINQKTMTGFHETTTPDVTTYQVYEGTDSEGHAIYSTHEEINGYWHNFHPDIHTTKVGSYQTPVVKFETGVNVGLNTALGVLAGAGIGAVAGGLAGAAISHVTGK